MTQALTLARLHQGGKAELARAIVHLELEPESDETIALLGDAAQCPRAHVIGLTGPPGVGKSTLTDRLVRAWRDEHLRVGVVAVDPSSQVSGGALLGDRTRLNLDPTDEDVFVRSLATRGRLGGLADLTFPLVVLMRALFDRVIVESVGVGQSEADIRSVTDSVVLCVQPGSGDSLQFMKAGIMEIPDIAVVTKADIGASAQRAAADLQSVLAVAREANSPKSVLCISAIEGTGIDEVIDTLSQHYGQLTEGGTLRARRDAQARGWVEASVQRQFGSQGLELLRRHRTNSDHENPFAAARSALRGFKLTHAGEDGTE